MLGIHVVYCLNMLQKCIDCERLNFANIHCTFPFFSVNTSTFIAQDEAHTNHQGSAGCDSESEHGSHVCQIQKGS